MTASVVGLDEIDAGLQLVDVKADELRTVGASLFGVTR